MSASKHTYPGPRGWELFKASLMMMYDPLRCLELAQQRHGDFVRLKMGGTDLFLLFDPQLIEKVYVSEADRYIKDVMTRKMSAVWGNGLLNSEGDEWKRQRFLMQPAFRHTHFETYGRMMVAQTKRMLAGWHPNSVRDVHQDMMKLTLEIVSQTLFGADIGEQTEEIAHCLEAIMDYFYFLQAAITFYPSPETIPVPSRRRFRQAIQRFDAAIAAVVAARRGQSEEGRWDLLSILLQEKARGGWMSDELLRDELITLFLAGHETTALVLTFCWLLLHENPEVEAALYRELDTVLGGREPGYADLERLEIAGGIVKESMRIYPPVWVTGREAARDCELGPYRLKKGDQLLTCQWVVHRDPRWFPEPMAFRPERWAKGKLPSPRFSYFPFGGGARVCIGNSFAQMEGTLLLATIAQAYQLRRTEDKPLQLLPSITIRPKGGLPMRLTSRLT